MPDKILNGDVGTRLRNFLRTVGRSGFTIDETVSPVVSVGALDADPYRTDPVTWSFAIDEPAGAGVFATIGITASASQVLLVDDCEASTFVAAGGFHLQLGRQANVAALGGFALLNVGVLNAPNVQVGGGLLLSRGFVAAPAASPVGSFDIFRQDAPVSTTLTYLGPPVVLYPGDSLYWVNLIVNQTMRAGMRGRAYDASYLRR